MTAAERGRTRLRACRTAAIVVAGSTFSLTMRLRGGNPGRRHASSWRRAPGSKPRRASAGVGPRCGDRCHGESLASRTAPEHMAAASAPRMPGRSRLGCGLSIFSCPWPRPGPETTSTSRCRRSTPRSRRSAARARAPAEHARDDRLGELRPARDPRGGRLRAHQQVRRGPARQALLRRLRVGRRRPSSSRSTAPRSCSAPSTRTSSRTPARRPTTPSTWRCSSRATRSSAWSSPTAATSRTA